jgi:hypothetical protein
VAQVLPRQALVAQQVAEVAALALVLVQDRLELQTPEAVAVVQLLEMLGVLAVLVL